ncbi:MAG: hypothetical protein V3R83_09720 [Gammaproteobacteria bacterium]
MPTSDLVPDFIQFASGWTGATVANLEAADALRATDGDVAEFITALVTNAPGDFGSLNTVQLVVVARRNGTPPREKQVLMELLDGSDNILESFTTGNLGSIDGQSQSSAFSRSDNEFVVNGYKARCTIQEGGGMPGGVTAEINHFRIVIDYDVAGAGPGLRTLALTGAGT